MIFLHFLLIFFHVIPFHFLLVFVRSTNRLYSTNRIIIRKTNIDRQPKRAIELKENGMKHSTLANNGPL